MSGPFWARCGLPKGLGPAYWPISAHPCLPGPKKSSSIQAPKPSKIRAQDREYDMSRRLCTIPKRSIHRWMRLCVRPKHPETPQLLRTSRRFSHYLRTARPLWATAMSRVCPALWISETLEGWLVLESCSLIGHWKSQMTLAWSGG